MKNKSGVSSTAQYQPNSTNNTPELASIEDGGFCPQAPLGGDKSFVAHTLGAPSSATEPSYVSFCPFTAGQYTEF
jgi:hypothetical protein